VRHHRALRAFQRVAERSLPAQGRTCSSPGLRSAPADGMPNVRGSRKLAVLAVRSELVSGVKFPDPRENRGKSPESGDRGGARWSISRSIPGSSPGISLRPTTGNLCAASRDPVSTQEPPPLASALNPQTSRRTACEKRSSAALVRPASAPTPSAGASIPTYASRSIGRLLGGSRLGPAHGPRLPGATGGPQARRDHHDPDRATRGPAAARARDEERPRHSLFGRS
jgi:hypothetical protein